MRDTSEVIGAAERRMRRWADGEHRDTDVAADVRVLLARIDALGPFLAVIPCPNPGEHEALRELHERADLARLAWVRMAPNPRTTVRAQSQELYDALGALSTYLAYASKAD